MVSEERFKEIILSRFADATVERDQGFYIASVDGEIVGFHDNIRPQGFEFDVERQDWSWKDIIE